MRTGVEYQALVRAHLAVLFPHRALAAAKFVVMHDKSLRADARPQIAG